MYRTVIRIGFGLSAVVLVAAGTAWSAGLLDQTLAMAAGVVAFPVFIVCLGLWWRASAGGEDLPFIGF